MISLLTIDALHMLKNSISLWVIITVIALYGIGTISIEIIPVMVYAVHQSDQTLPCSVKAKGQMFPITYNGTLRNNPDGSFYPVDSFYYLIQFSASHTCVGMHIDPLISHDGLDVYTHNMTAWHLLDVDWYKWMHPPTVITRDIDPHKIMINHKHAELVRQPKLVEFTQYHDITDGSMLFSIKEGQSISTTQKRDLERLEKNDENGHYTNITHAWDFIQVQIPHIHLPYCEIPNVQSDTSKEEIPCYIKDRYIDPESISEFQGIVKERCSTIRVYSGCIFGMTTINEDIINPQCLFEELDKLNTPKEEYPKEDICVNSIQEISLKVTGFKKVCTRNYGGPITCKATPIPKNITLMPEIIIPSIDTILTKQILVDTDGYKTQNLDGTYYMWDPVTIKHVPHMKWKDHRDNTIQFQVNITNSISIVNSIRCNANECYMKLEHPGVITSRWHLGNGDGLTMYNATAPTHLGLHRITYNITAYNNDIFIGFDVTHIDVLIVRYTPIYTEYPYSLLSDDKRTSYENRAAIALHYWGSVGDGPGDTPGIHKERRSKINAFVYTGVGFDPWYPVMFNETLIWSDTVVGVIVNTPTNNNTDHTNMKTDVITPCVTGKENTTMLVKAGYCKVYFTYDIIDVIHDIDTGPKYENVTLFNTLISEKFAGKQHTYLSHYEYQFPEAIFNTDLEIVSLKQGGEPTPIKIDIKPKNITEHQTISDYIYDKVMWDSADSGLAYIISEDVYPRYYSSVGDSGDTIQVKLRRVSSKFQMDNSWSPTNVYTGHTNNGSDMSHLQVPLSVGLGALSPISITISANQQTKQYDHDYIDFNAVNKITINVAHDNQLNITRYDGSITILPESNFGEISKIYVNDTQITNVSCGRMTCTIQVLGYDPLSIRVENTWGGQAHVDVPMFVPTRVPGIPIIDNGWPLVIFVLLMGISYFSYHYLKNRR